MKSKLAARACFLGLIPLFSLHCSDAPPGNPTSTSSASTSSTASAGGNGGGGAAEVGGNGGTGGVTTGGNGGSAGNGGTGGAATGGNGGMAGAGMGGNGGAGGGGGSGAGWPVNPMLDPTFGSNGMTLINAPATNSDFILATAQQADGKLLLAGHTNSGYGDVGEALLVRVNPNGSLDPSFGDGGHLITSPAPFHSYFQAVSVDGQGRLIAVMIAPDTSGQSRLFVVRYQPNGTLDSTFGNGGFAKPTNFGFGYVIPTFEPTGRIVAYGTTTDPAYPSVLLRILPDGTLDPNFGTAGIQLVDNVPFFGYNDVAVDGDGKILLLARTFGNSKGTVTRFLSNGPRDMSFGASGVAVSPIATLQTMVPAGNGAILLGGFENLSGSSDGIIARLNAQGALDTTFGNAGMTRISGPNSNTIYRLSLDPNGRPLATGYLDGAAVAMRFLSTGQLDTTYGNAGSAQLSFWQALNQEVFPDGSITAVSRELNGINQHIEVVRVNGAGTPDIAYGMNGKLSYASGAPSDVAIKMFVEPDGKVVSVGHTSGAKSLMMTRQMPDGALDPTFGTGGIALFTNTVNQSAHAARTPMGDYYVMGPGPFNQAIYAIASNGTLLSTFGVNGAVTEQFPAGTTIYNWGLLVDMQGRVVSSAAGDVPGAGFVCRVRLKRLLSTGQIDSSFDADGIVETDFMNRTTCQPRGLVELPDGKLVVGMTYRPIGMPQESSLVRYESSGSIDSTFGSAGVAILPGALVVENVVLMADGRYVAVGHRAGMVGTLPKDIAVARMLPNGQPDTTFGGGTGFVVVPTATTVLSSPIGQRGPGVIVHADGSMLVAGSMAVGSNLQMVIVRLLPNGDLDPNYGNAGLKVVPSLPGNFAAFSIGEQPSGKIVVGGYGFWPTTGTDFATLRLAP